jgi:hypothetical protein
MADILGLSKAVGIDHLSDDELDIENNNVFLYLT